MLAYEMAVELPGASKFCADCALAQQVATFFASVARQLLGAKKSGCVR